MYVIVTWIEHKWMTEKYTYSSKKVMKLRKQRTGIIIWMYVPIFMIVEIADAHMTA